MSKPDRLVVGVRIRVDLGRSQRTGTVVHIIEESYPAETRTVCVVDLDRIPGDEGMRYRDVGVFADQLEIIYG